jgi:hypothetical protein
MGTRGQIIFGLFLVFLGVMYILGIVFNIDTGALCWPAFLILLGVWLLVRPKGIILIGDYRRKGPWDVEPIDVWIGIGDVRLNFAESEIPPGETIFRVNGLIGDFRAEVPAGIPVMVNASAFIVDTNIFDEKRNNFFTPVRFVSAGYDTADRKLRFETTHLIGDVKVRHP